MMSKETTGISHLLGEGLPEQFAAYRAELHRGIRGERTTTTGPVTSASSTTSPGRGGGSGPRREGRTSRSPPASRAGRPPRREAPLARGVEPPCRVGTHDRDDPWATTTGSGSTRPGPHATSSTTSTTTEAASGIATRRGGGSRWPTSRSASSRTSRGSTELPIRQVLFTSSANLGIHAYVKFGTPHVTSKVLDYFAAGAAGAGLDCEIYPNISNCLRRPFGYGSWTLSSRGILGTFAEQMDHYLDPSPLPPFEQVVEMLIDLWVDQHGHLAACYDEEGLRPWEPRVDVPARIAAMNEQVDRIRDWVSRGCPDRERANAIALSGRGSKKKAGEGTGQRWPEDCKPPRMSWLDRVHRLASGGLWLPDTLNPRIARPGDLAAGGRVPRRPGTRGGGREAPAGLLARKHNGMSDRLAGVEDGRKVACSGDGGNLRRRLPRQGGDREVCRARERNYGKPLRVAYLLTGEGEPNAYGIPGAAGDFGSMEREHYHPFIGGHFAVPLPGWRNCWSRVAWTSPCRARSRQSSRRGQAR